MNICVVEDCNSLTNYKDYCGLHYQRLRRTGTLEARAYGRACEVEGCDNPHKSNGYCNKHHHEYRKNKDNGECSWRECSRNVRYRGMCSRHYDILVHYKLDEQHYMALVVEQSGRCAICLTDVPGGRHGVWNIDHDHSCCAGTITCGKCVRGLLCANCNSAIGMFEDDIETVKAAARYLEVSHA